MQPVRNFFRKKSKTQNKGKEAEQKAEDYLQSQGLTFVERNYFCRVGEIDLIFLDNDVYVFIEVRFRATNQYGSAAESLTSSKLTKIRKTAELWLKKNNKLHYTSRFDAILFDQKIHLSHLTWLKAIF